MALAPADQQLHRAPALQAQKHLITQLFGEARPLQARFEAYDPQDMANPEKVRKVEADEALGYLSPEGGALSEGQLKWLEEVVLRLHPESLKAAVSRLASADTLVDFADRQPNSAAVAILTALEKSGTGKGEAATSRNSPLKSTRDERKPPAPLAPSKKKGRPKFIKLELGDDSGFFKGLAAEGEIDPRRVKFSQDTAGLHYAEPFKLGKATVSTVEQHAIAMKTEGGSSTPAIEIVLYKGAVMTLNNRRLKAHQLAGVSIPFRKSKTFANASDTAIAQHPNVDAAAPRNNLTLR